MTITTAEVPIRPVGFTDDLVDFLEPEGAPRNLSILYNTATTEFHVAHDCKVVDLADGPIQLRIAPRLDDRHRTPSRKPLTIRPSIGCGDCGLHGWIDNDQWRDA